MCERRISWFLFFLVPMFEWDDPGNEFAPSQQNLFLLESAVSHRTLSAQNLKWFDNSVFLLLSIFARTFCKFSCSYPTKSFISNDGHTCWEKKYISIPYLVLLSVSSCLQNSKQSAQRLLIFKRRISEKDKSWNKYKKIWLRNLN